MKVSHLIALALIAFIVYRLTRDVQGPSAPEPERKPAVQVIQRTGEPTITIRGDNGDRSGSDGGAERTNTDSMLKLILQRLAAAVPKATPKAESSSEDWTLPKEPAVAGSTPAAPAPTPAVLSPRARLRVAQERRLVLLKQYGPPSTFQGTLRRHFDNDKIAVGTTDAGECVVEEFEPGQRQADGSLFVFDAWIVGTQVVFDAEGKKRTIRRMIYATPALPLWDKFGRPINRDVIPAEVIRDTSIHTSTALDKKPKRQD